MKITKEQKQNKKNLENMNEELLTASARRTKELISLGANPHYEDEFGKNAFYHWKNKSNQNILSKAKIGILLENGVSFKGNKERESAIRYISSCFDSFGAVNDMIDMGCYESKDINLLLKFGIYSNREAKDIVKYLEKLESIGYDLNDVTNHLFKNQKHVFDFTVRYDPIFIDYLKSKGVNINEMRSIENYNEEDGMMWDSNEFFYHSIFKEEDDNQFDFINDAFIVYAAKGKLNPEITIHDIHHTRIMNMDMFNEFYKSKDFKEMACIINFALSQNRYYYLYLKDELSVAFDKLSSSDKVKLFEHVKLKMPEETDDERHFELALKIEKEMILCSVNNEVKEEKEITNIKRKRL